MIARKCFFEVRRNTKFSLKEGICYRNAEREKFGFFTTRYVEGFDRKDAGELASRIGNNGVKSAMGTTGNNGVYHRNCDRAAPS